MKRDSVRMTSEACRIVRGVGYLLGFIVLVMTWLIVKEGGSMVLPLLIAAAFMAMAVRLARVSGYVTITPDLVEIKSSLFDQRNVKSAPVSGFEKLVIGFRGVHNAAEHSFSYFFIKLTIKGTQPEQPPQELSLADFYSSKSASEVMKKAREISRITGLEVTVEKGFEVYFK